MSTNPLINLTALAFGIVVFLLLAHLGTHW